MHRDNQPTFNTDNQRVANFKDFEQNIDSEKQELDDIKKGFRKNAKKIGQQEHKLKWDKKTNKLTDLTEMEVDDKIEQLEESNSLKHLKKF